MKKRILIIIFTLILLGIPFFTLASGATRSWSEGGIKLQVSIGGRTEVADVADYILTLYKYFVGVAGILAVVMMMWGGFRWLTALGNVERISKAKENISSALIGLLLLLTSYIILYTINPDLVKLKLPEITPIKPVEIAEEEQLRTCYEGDLQRLADEYNVPYQAQDAPALTTLMNCIEGPGGVPSYMIDQRYRFTVGETHWTLNFTRGERICEQCTPGECHSVYSCHYGGRTGTEGAMAVDYNAAPGFTETQLYYEIDRVLKEKCSDLYEPNEYLGPGVEGDHTHIGAKGCGG